MFASRLRPLIRTAGRLAAIAVLALSLAVPEAAIAANRKAPVRAKHVAKKAATVKAKKAKAATKKASARHRATQPGAAQHAAAGRTAKKAHAPRRKPKHGPALTGTPQPPAAAAHAMPPPFPVATTVCRRDGRIYLLHDCSALDRPAALAANTADWDAR